MSIYRKDPFAKRLWQTGCNSMFTVVDWYGDEDQWDNKVSNQVFDGTVSPDYYGNVLHAFQTAKSLATETAKLPGEKVLIAHSLGNILTSAAIKDWHMEYSRYFMLNAAVAMEAYDDAAYEPTMIDPVWKSVINTKENYLASRWSRLFEESHGGLDFRRSLSWKGRFAGIENAVNCYSTTEDVTGNIDTNKTRFGWTVWAKQEMFKGTLLWHGTAVVPGDVVCEVGWGINTYYGADIRYYVPIHGFTAKVNNLTRKDAIEHPLFTPFRTNEVYMTSTNLYVVADANERYELRARFLGDAIPAESFAMGANPVPKWGNKARLGYRARKNTRNYDMAKDCIPKDLSEDVLKWSHSYFIQKSLIETGKLYEFLIENME